MVLTISVTWGCSSLKSEQPPQPAGSTVVPATSAENAPTYYDFGDVLLPSELKINKKDSFVFRTPGLTAGVLALSGRVDTNSLAAFFEKKMPVDGWEQVSAFKAPRSMILFKKQTRWCVISITEGNFTTNVEIWVAPTIDHSMSSGLR